MSISHPPSYDTATKAGHQHNHQHYHNHHHQQTAKPTVVIQPRNPPPQQQQQQQHQQQQQQTVYAIAHPNLGGVTPVNNERPPTRMSCSILTTLCCCLPFGIVAIVRSAEARMALKCDNVPLAVKYSKKARFWNYTSLMVGIVFNVLYILYLYYYNYNEPYAGW